MHIIRHLHGKSRCEADTTKQITNVLESLASRQAQNPADKSSLVVVVVVDIGGW